MEFFFSTSSLGRKYSYLEILNIFKEMGIRNVELGVCLETDLNVDKLMDIYGLADLVVIPSLWEGSPLVPVEAMAMGKAVVGTRVGGLEPMIVHGRTGYLVAKNDPGELAEKIIELLTNDKQLRKMSRNARSYMEKKHSIDAMVEKHVKVYDKLYS